MLSSGLSDLVAKPKIDLNLTSSETTHNKVHNISTLPLSGPTDGETKNW